MHAWKKRLFILILFALCACTAKKDGAIEGRISPPTAGARITATRDGKTVTTVDAGTADGRFRVLLAPGTYEIAAVAPSSPFPVTFSAVEVKAGETTGLPPVEFAPAGGNATLAGKIAPAGPATRVKLLYEGQERATREVGPDGGYEFSGLAGGRYTMIVHSPGYAEDRTEFTLTGDRREEHAVRLLYRTAVDGVDWTAGTIRARGVGMPPPRAPNASVRREMARRAALADGQRNLLRTIEQINVDATRTVKDLLARKEYTEKLQGFIKGYRVVAERELDDGRREVDLELPLAGPGGLSSSLLF